jgi:hypothetical protein
VKAQDEVVVVVVVVVGCPVKEAFTLLIVEASAPNDCKRESIDWT